MAIRGDARVADAIRSLQADIVPVEVIVVNTGAPSLAPLLTEYLDRIVLVEGASPLLPGGTRNLGVPEARGPVVAFLAADCLAGPGWTTQRILAHQTAPAVASAILPAPPADGRVPTISWAVHMLVYARRDPDYPPDRTVRYGVSYRRDVLAENGPFLEDRMDGEDTEFNDRLQEPPVWDPAVVTLHRNPLNIAAALSDARRRGARCFDWTAANTRHPSLRALRRIIGTFIYGLSLLVRLPSSRRGPLFLATPFLFVLTITQIGGALARAVSRPPSQPR